jgi:hypothetical protein
MKRALTYVFLAILIVPLWLLHVVVKFLKKLLHPWAFGPREKLAAEVELAFHFLFADYGYRFTSERRRRGPRGFNYAEVMLALPGMPVVYRPWPQGFDGVGGAGVSAGRNGIRPARP